MQIFFYNKEVERFIEKLEKQTIGKVLRLLDLLEKFGNDLNMPYSKCIGGGLFELRVRGIQEVRFYTLSEKKKS
ncbi:MAG: type II toxin-antitoxin system RelE/ParE family toxin [Patescibacteria group bacterium]